MRRGGGHAVINWFYSMMGDPTLHFNNCLLSKGARDLQGRLLYREKTGRVSYRTQGARSPSEYPTPRNVVYSYEDKILIEGMPIRFREMGSSERSFDVIILRDLFNWAASALVYSGGRALSDFPERACDTANKRLWASYASNMHARNAVKFKEKITAWVSLAKEILGKTKYLESPVLSILYDRWFSDVDYRKQIAEKLGMTYAEKMMNEVAITTGTGSNFDHIQYEGRAQEMPVLDRWEFFVSNPIYWKLIESNSEAEELNKEIFGNTIEDRSLYPIGRMARTLYDAIG
jgi:hypothetical protein